MYFHMAAHICTVSDRGHIVAVSLLSVERNSLKEDNIFDISSHSPTVEPSIQAEPSGAH